MATVILWNEVDGVRIDAEAAVGDGLGVGGAGDTLAYCSIGGRSDAG